MAEEKSEGKEKGGSKKKGVADKSAVTALTDIWFLVNQSIADMSMQNYGVARTRLDTACERLANAVSYFGGSVGKNCPSKKN